MMSKEIYERLKEYENILKYALSMDYLRVTPDVFKVLAEIYKDYTGKALTKSQMNCNSCRIKAIKELGKGYYAYTPEEKPKPKKIQKLTVKSEPHTEKTSKYRKGRPRKIDVVDLAVK
jgi:hypothetical protein